MSPRIIQIPLSGGDRKKQAKGIRHANGLHATYYAESVLIRGAAEEKIREADKLECEALERDHVGRRTAMPSPDDPMAEPTIGKALNCGYDLLEVKCALVPLRSIKRPARTPLWKLEPVLFCESCSDLRPGGRKQRAHILSVTFACPDREAPSRAGEP